MSNQCPKFGKRLFEMGNIGTTVLRFENRPQRKPQPQPQQKPQREPQAKNRNLGERKFVYQYQRNSIYLTPPIYLTSLNFECSGNCLKGLY